MTDKIFITDAGQRKAVPIIRALGRSGLSVVAGENSRWSMGFYSKYCGKKYVYPDPEKEADFIGWLIDHAKKGVFTILFPIDERTMTPVTKHLSELQKYVLVPVVDHPTYMMARDKWKTLETAKKVGVPIPKTWWYATLEEFHDKKNEVEIPCIIKPRSSSGSRGLKIIPQAEALEHGYLAVHEQYPYPLIQELIPHGGETFGVEFLLDQGHVLAHFMHKRLREYPIAGGPSTLRESVYDKELIETASRLLSSIGWHGVAMVEFKVDPRNGLPKLMEINPKFWGSIALPIVAGVNFPYLLYQLAIGEPVHAPPSYRAHVRCRWLIPGDILHFLANPNRFQLQPGFFDFKGESDDLVDPDDWGPLYGMFLSFLSQVRTERFWTKYIRRG